MSQGIQTEPPLPRGQRVRKGRCCCCLFFLLLLLLVPWSLWCLRDRNPGYDATLSVDGAAARAEPKALRVGFARQTINPDLSDPQGKPVWLAGFRIGRAATGLHDDLWAVGCVIDDGHTRVGIVALDAIGFFNTDVISVRRRVAEELKLSYVIVTATHNHSTPDLMGLWGRLPGVSGVDPAYREQVIGTCVQVLGEATAELAPAEMTLRRIPLHPDGLVEDTRDPQVFDADLRMMQFTHPGGDQTLGSIVTWGDHPETVWSRNTEITADFPGYLRDGLENGLTPDDEGLGGIHMFVNGAVGGLMTTSPRVTVRDPVGGAELKDPTHAKAKALGFGLAEAALKHVRGPWNIERAATPAFTIKARTIDLAVDNWRFLVAPVLGVLDRGHVRWGRLRSEVAFLTLGDASILCVPGEIYPEIVNGGVERAPGGDFDIEPLEVPPLRELMPGRVKFVFGLANDEVGYIIPKSEWDTQAPYLYGADESPYGEVNSLGPETAPELHGICRELLGN